MVATLVALHLGLALIGRSAAEVTAQLGRPVAVERYPVRFDYRYRRLEVIFGDGKRATAFLATPAWPPCARNGATAAIRRAASGRSSPTTGTGASSTASIEGGRT